LTVKQALILINTELATAISLYPSWPTDIIHQVAILNEEAGETVKAANNFIHHNGEKDEIIKEAVQTGAMAIRLLMNL